MLLVHQKIRDSFNAGTPFEEHSEGDPEAKWPAETIRGDEFCCP